MTTNTNWFPGVGKSTLAQVVVVCLHRRNLSPKMMICKYLKRAYMLALATSFWCGLISIHFNPVNSQWQRRLYQQLGLSYQRANQFGRGGPNCALTLPNLTTVRRIVADGNCLFRALSSALTGWQGEHMTVRTAIIDHMVRIAHLLLGVHVQQSSIRAYIQNSRMSVDGKWGTDIEICTFANLCQTNVYVYDTQHGSRNVFPPGLSLTFVDVSIMPIYLLHPIDHYDVVSFVRKT